MYCFDARNILTFCHSTPTTHRVLSMCTHVPASRLLWPVLYPKVPGYPISYAIGYPGIMLPGYSSPTCARHCAVKCLHTWLMISISSPKATDDPFCLPLITCVRCHVRTTASETAALALPVREFGTVCHVACEHLTSATNILKHY